mmetsp:Transcript_63289/g.72548  ORF Transcript_63289/g.72548 Transcript_63289/m.72548 type:complete len:215 (+) Transcript_63289:123-767(+)|eukprot:CAMPEP_0115030460 /NCGR_PEP_ID=MMETSP0216-20121206/37803_1 /TAXON_ID=223996 /ORGANISM="Protocruzia adherens, Strain Boccale" /LENGTH=214 /DNA_ID=CAMNT_0002407627 /DNA_START=634 /DNA_END=1278 /DNA_ORIENTATION=-
MIKKLDLEASLEEKEEIVQCLDQVLKQDPEHKLAIMRKGEMLYKAGKEDQALELFERATNLGLIHREMYFYQGLSHRARGENDQALRSLTSAVELEPGEYGARFERAGMLYGQNLFKDSLRDVDHLLRLKPDSLNPKYAKALTLKSLGRYQESLEYYNLVEEKLGKTFSLGYSDKAELYTALSCFQEARDMHMGLYETSPYTDVEIDTSTKFLI